MQRRYVAVRGASLAGGAFQSWLGDILGSRPAAEGWSGAAVGDFLREGDAFPLEGRLQKSGKKGGAFGWVAGGKKERGLNFLGAASLEIFLKRRSREGEQRSGKLKGTERSREMVLLRGG